MHLTWNPPASFSLFFNLSRACSQFHTSQPHPAPQDERGVSHDEMAAALVEIGEGRIPNDRIALKCLHDEITKWPFLDVGGDVPAAARKEAPAAAAAAAGSGKPNASDYGMLLGVGAGRDWLTTVLPPQFSGDS